MPLLGTVYALEAPLAVPVAEVVGSVEAQVTVGPDSPTPGTSLASESGSGNALGRQSRQARKGTSGRCEQH